ncbi:MAG: iron-sulfur cluster assembly protein [Candidatus Sericytochromatia bacterium]|nr:iron-sulfur cluster assembly protein [Candidatus Sericytochromatia bacterium]
MSGEVSMHPEGLMRPNHSEDEIARLEEEMVTVFKTIHDPEIPVDIYELGLIYEHRLTKDGTAYVVMTLTSPGCPVAGSMPGEVRQKIEAIEGVWEAEVEVTWEPAWTKDMMSEVAKLQLNMY